MSKTYLRRVFTAGLTPASSTGDIESFALANPPAMSSSSRTALKRDMAALGYSGEQVAALLPPAEKSGRPARVIDKDQPFSALSPPAIRAVCRGLGVDFAGLIHGCTWRDPDAADTARAALRAHYKSTGAANIAVKTLDSSIASIVAAASVNRCTVCPTEVPAPKAQKEKTRSRPAAARAAEREQRYRREGYESGLA